VCLKRSAGVEKSLRFGERLLRRQGEIVGHSFDPGRVVRQGPPQFVARAGVARAPRGIPVPPTLTRWTHPYAPWPLARRWRPV
jgi:hypothetical protein